jgi:hypothetical protein
MKIEFIEEQKFTQKWLWVFLVVVGLLPVYGIYKQIFLGEPIGDNPLSNSGLIIISIFTFSFIAMFLFMKLETDIDREEIRMNFFPFVKKRISWREIKSAKVVNYGFVGGWGIRFGTKYGTVYNIKGNQGLAIELLNGRKFLIGTQKEDELSEVLMTIG